jgi:hypothetical protein
MIIRGYDVTERSDGCCDISKNGKAVCSQPSIDLTRKWINEQRHKEIQAERQTS